MALQPGSTLGPYEILALLGAGGMGEVYRARDPRLNRDVAIKVLPSDRVSDQDRRRRFVQEAHAASALNHPHIVTIYEIEEANGFDFIVMEYVRGKSLDATIPRHGMRLGDVLRIAIAVADALAAAHARGIIHRDLKPANVMVGADGAVKVLDFGLAKLIGHEDPDDGELTHTANVALSAPGTIAGTAAYMSPEQATGAKVDARSDVFSFGAMLYEMVTGVRAFAGASMADTLAAVVRAQLKPPIEIVATVPIDLQKTILRCLRKDPERRFQHISDVKVALQEIKEESESGPATATAPNQRRSRLIGALVASAVLVASLTAWRLWPHGDGDAPQRVVPLTALNGNEGEPTFSPDGEQVAFSWDGGVYSTSDIYVKLVGSPEVRQLTTDPAFDVTPSWSPDGRQIAFLRFPPGGAEGRIHLVSPLGGIASKLSEFPTSDQLAWSPDGRILAAARLGEPGNDSTGIFAIPVDGGESRALTQTKRPAVDRSPAFSPDGRRLAYMCCREVSLPTCNVCVLDLNATYRPMGAPRRLSADPAIVRGLRWTRDGHAIVYGTQPFPGLAYLWRIAESGDLPAERIEVAGLGAMDPAPALSRNRLAFTQSFVDIDVYRFRPGHAPEPVLVSPFGDWQGQVSPDGRHIVFSTSRSGEGLAVWVAAADGSAARPLLPGMHRWHGGPSWSPDSRRIAFDWRDEGGDSQLWTIDASGGPPHQLTKGRGFRNHPTWSRDGRTIYFSADQGTGRNLWRVSATGGTPIQITKDGSGILGLESPDGNSVLYQRTDDEAPLLAVPVGGGPPRQLLNCVESTAFGVAGHGLYYVPCGPDEAATVHVFDLSTGRDRLLGKLERFTSAYNEALSVSPDGTTILYHRVVSDGADLMLIENFR